MSTAIAQQQIISQNPLYNLQINNTSQKQSNDHNSILVQNIDKFVTESMLHQKFSQAGEIKLIKLKANRVTGVSEGRALIEFKNSSSVQEAIKKFNMKKFFENNEASASEQKYMQVIPKLSKEEAEKIKYNRVFFKVPSTAHVQPENLIGPLSVLGDVHQIRIASKKGKLLNYGVVVLKEQEAKARALDVNEEGKPKQNIGIDIIFENYDEDQESYNIHVTEHNLINQVVSDEILKDQAKKQNEQIRLTNIIKADLDKKQITYTSLSLNIDEGHKKAFFFISVGSKKVAEQLIQDFQAAGAKCTLSSKQKDPNTAYKHLHLKSLKVPQFTEEERKKIVEDYKRDQNIEKDEKIIIQDYADKKIEEKIISDLKQLNITKVTVKVSAPQKPGHSKPEQRTFEDSRQATLFFESSADGINLVSSYLKPPMASIIKNWFLNENAHANVNVLLSQPELEVYKKAINKGISQQLQSYQRVQAQQQLQNVSQDQARIFQQQTESVGPNYARNNQFVQQNYPQGQYQQGNQGFQKPYNNQNQRYSQNINNSNQRRLQPGNQVYNNLQGGQQQPRSVQYQGQNRPYPQQASRSQGPQGHNNYQQNQQFNQSRPSNQAHPQQQIPPQIVDQKKSNINPQPIQGVVTQQTQNVTQQVMTLDQIRAQADEFVKKPQEQQKSILGQLIYPKVKEALDLRKEDSKVLTPKITGMLIDFSVFELEDIIEMIDNKEDLAERIDEALELIKSTANKN